MVPGTEITRPAHRESLPDLLAFVEDACERAGAGPGDCFALKLAVGEACTNLIEHGYPTETPGSIRLRVTTAPGRIVVTIVDTAPQFDPEALPDPDLNADGWEQFTGGLGWYLIRRMMDEVVYRPGADENRLILVKKTLSVF